MVHAAGLQRLRGADAVAARVLLFDIQLDGGLQYRVRPLRDVQWDQNALDAVLGGELGLRRDDQDGKIGVVQQSVLHRLGSQT